MLALFALLWFPLGVASTTFTTADQTVLQRTSAPEFQGRVMSLFTIAWMGTTPVGGLIAGALVDAFSARAALGLGAAMTFLAGAAALLASRSRAGCQDQPRDRVRRTGRHRDGRVTRDRAGDRSSSGQGRRHADSDGSEAVAAGRDGR
jgi:MFS family permease